MNVPHPDSLSIDEILTTLSDSVFINCFEEQEKHFGGLLYAFDAAGNWSKSEFWLTVFSNNCIYYCPTETFTKLSFKDSKGNSLDQIIAPAYGKEMEIQDSLYLYRVCTADTTLNRLNFYRKSNILEGVSTFDLLLIQQHILGKKPFTTFQQFAAADVNFSGDITAFDILTIKRTILGFNSNFNYGTNWIFYEKNKDLETQQPNIDVLPLHLWEEKRFALKDTTYYFLGVKLGNVSQ